MIQIACEQGLCLYVVPECPGVGLYEVPEYLGELAYTRETVQLDVDLVARDIVGILLPCVAAEPEIPDTVRDWYL